MPKINRWFPFEVKKKKRIQKENLKTSQTGPTVALVVL
jgi:hypothetical protein